MSYIQLSSEKIKELCTKKLNKINQAREQSVNKWYDEMLSTKTVSLGWFKGKRSITRQEATDIGMKVVIQPVPPYYWPAPLRELNSLYAKEKLVCNKLLKALEFSSEIFVSIEDLELIS